MSKVKTPPDELNRFKKIFFSTAMKKNDFAALLGISRQNFDKYLSGDNDIKSLSRKLYEAGFSVHWLFGGEGRMFLDETESDFEWNKLDNYDFNDQKDRIKEWVLDVFVTFDEFKKETKLEGNLVDEYFSGDLTPTYDIYKELDRLGCNIKWTITGEGSRFQRSKSGKTNKNRMEINTSEY